VSLTVQPLLTLDSVTEVSMVGWFS
jgi:hypothetical protein